jgi:hypothetical protein
MSRVIVFRLFEVTVVKILRQRSESGITILLQTGETDMKYKMFLRKADPTNVL